MERERSASHAAARAALLAVTLLVASSCATFRAVPLHSIREQVHAGDVVRAETARGTIEMEVIAVGPDTLVGTEQRVPFEEIQSLELHHGFEIGAFSASLLALVILGAALVLVALDKLTIFS